MTLQRIYGHEAESQGRRYAAASRAFVRAYGPGEVRVFRAPGRVNLIGEHTDYNHGYVLPVALDKDILLVARPRSDNLLRLTNLEAGFPPLSFTIGKDIPPGPPGDWGNYARGVAQQLARQLGRPLHGLDGLVASRPPYGVPRQVGLSSSSALTVAIAVALTRFNNWRPDSTRLAQFCSEAEWYVGTRGGIMDQFIALLGKRGHALFLDCRPMASQQYTMEHTTLPQRHRLLIADSGVRHQNVRGEYNQRVAACRAGVKLLQERFPDITHLRDVQTVPWRELILYLPEQTTVGELQERGIDLGDVPALTVDTKLKVRARCRHVLAENRRVLATRTALRAGDIAAVGKLLEEAHASARDDYEVSCPELEILVTAAGEVSGVVGARLTGAGWGGCIVALVRDKAVPDFMKHVQQRFQSATGHTTNIFVCRSGPSAGECSPE